MEAKDTTTRKEEKEGLPKLFLFTNKKTETEVKKDTEGSSLVPVKIHILEMNLLKIRSPKNFYDDSGKQSQANELSDFKKEYMFYIPKEEIPKCKLLKNNYLPEDDFIEITLPMNSNLYTTSFEAIRQIILFQIAREKQGSSEATLKIEEHNHLELFVAACCLQYEDVVLKIYEELIMPKLSTKVLINVLLLVFEYSLPQASLKLYKTFREFWISRQPFAVNEPSPIVQKILSNEDGTNLVYDKDQYFSLYENLELLLSFSPNIFKKAFENLRKLKHDKYLKPETRYHVLKITRERGHNDDDGTWEPCYPHKYFMVYDHKDDTIISCTRESEYGEFRLFGSESDEMVYGENYVGCIQPNTWGTAFEVYDDGIDEKHLENFPKYICSPRQKIAMISYETNILGEAPRNFKVAFYNFLERKVDQLESVKPKYDKKYGCYFLNFYGRAKKASARNFILIDPNDTDSIILMHGKVEKDLFNLDFRHPLNFIQAFSISLVSIGKKFCVA